MKKCLLVLGATSAIARATVDEFAKEGYSLFLTGRNMEALERLAQNYRLRFQVEVMTAHFDAEEFGEHEKLVEHVLSHSDGIEGVLLAFGDLGQPHPAMLDFEQTNLIISRNFTGACSVLIPLARYFEMQKGGFIIGISSVAGDASLKRNYVYAAAKSALTQYLQGLRLRLYPFGVRVLTVKPGWVDTPMVQGRKEVFFTASPEYVGKRIVRALHRGKDVVYIPWFWRFIVFLVRMTPQWLLKRLPV